MKTAKKNRTIRRISKYLFEYKLLFATTLILACIMTTLSVLVPSVIQEVLDRIFTLNPSIRAFSSQELLLLEPCF